jgi:hypothetical protein
VEVAHRLALDENVGAERVIAGEQNSRLDVEPKLCESFRNAAVLLVDVRSYAHTSTLEPDRRSDLKMAQSWHLHAYDPA